MGASDLDEETWSQAFAPMQNDNAPTLDRIEFNDAGFKIQEKWLHNKDGTWRGYYVRRWFGIVRVGATAGRRGKLSKHIKGSRILRASPKRTRGGKGKQASADTQASETLVPVL